VLAARGGVLVVDVAVVVAAAAAVVHLEQVGRKQIVEVISLPFEFQLTSEIDASSVPYRRQ